MIEAKNRKSAYIFKHGVQERHPIKYRGITHKKLTYLKPLDEQGYLF